MTTPANTVPFPLNIRALQEGWKIFFFESARYRRNPSKTDEWNRGAYLAEALSDCSGCHTPRNVLGAELIRKAYSGALVDAWIAPALDAANPSPIPWTQGELFTYLRTGVTPLHGTTGATMTPVIRQGLPLIINPSHPVFQPITGVPLSYDGPRPTLIWSAMPGLTYRLQDNSDLNSTNWHDLPHGPTSALVDLAQDVPELPVHLFEHGDVLVRRDARQAAQPGQGRVHPVVARSR